MARKIDHHIGSLVESWSRRRFYAAAAVSVLAVGAGSVAWPPLLVAYAVVLPLVVLGVRDATQTRHTIMRNFPLLGRLRYVLESLRPEVRQYFVESDSEENPFSREKRSVVFQRAKGVPDTVPFGTRRDVYAVGYEWLSHSLHPVEPAEDAGRVQVGGPECTRPYSASILNISAMSYGSLSGRAVLALNRGAAAGGFAHNTGEGGISPYHLEGGGDLVWQIGTGYFGCRTPDGRFDPGKFAERAGLPAVRMIEVKLSQGAKPGHGGLLPASKVTPEIAAIRGVPLGSDVLSPPAHTAFIGPEGLLEFLARLRELSGGKPVGFKLCVGSAAEWFALARAMSRSGLAPDFVTVDGAEGGTGAAPLEFSNSVGMPLTDGLALVHDTLVGLGVRDQVRVLAAGKITTGFHLLHKLALGADACNAARAMMFALGCIQALKCNTNLCPTGVATQDPELVAGLHVPTKAERVASFHRRTVESALDLLGAAGVEHPRGLTRAHVQRRVGPGDICSLAEIHPPVTPGCLREGEVPDRWRRDWERETPWGA